MTPDLGALNTLKHACSLSIDCLPLCSTTKFTCYPRHGPRQKHTRCCARRLGNLSCQKRYGRAQATSLALSLPLAGGLNSMASMSGHTNSAGEPTPSSSNHEGHHSMSVDPQASGENIVVIHSPQELAAVLSSNQDKLVCLMCKAIGCRPCKVFARKYQRIATSYQNCVFLECTGDETIELRKLMIQMGIRSTPTFRLYSGGECIKTHVGIDDQKLRTALDSCLGEGDTVQEVEHNFEGTQPL